MSTSAAASSAPRSTTSSTDQTVRLRAVALIAAIGVSSCSTLLPGPSAAAACWGDRDMTPGTLTGVLRANPKDPYLASTWLVRADGKGFDVGWPSGFTEETGRAPARHHRIFVPPAEAEVVFAEEGDTVRLIGGLHANGDTFFVCEADGPNGHWPGPGETSIHATPG